MLFRSTFDELRDQIENSEKQLDLALVERAYQAAKRAHGEQRRVSGEPYIIHPLNVASILVGLGMDTETIIAALLHDVVEDTPVTLEEVSREFGREVALLVDGVTKLGKIPFSSSREEKFLFPPGKNSRRRTFGRCCWLWRRMCGLSLSS